jgi:hypothetical protein
LVHRFNLDFNVTIVTLTTRLFDVLTFSLCFAGNSFSVGNLWFTNIGFYSKLTLHTINDNLKVKFSHTSDDCFFCFWISRDLKCWIFISKFIKS